MLTLRTPIGFVLTHTIRTNVRKYLTAIRSPGMAGVGVIVMVVVMVSVAISKYGPNAVQMVMQRHALRLEPLAARDGPLGQPSPEQTGQTESLRAQLELLKISQLRKRAAAASVDAAALEEAEDSDEPKQAMITLLLQVELAKASAGPRELIAAKAEERIQQHEGPVRAGGAVTAAAEPDTVEDGGPIEKLAAVSGSQAASLPADNFCDPGDREESRPDGRPKPPKGRWQSGLAQIRQLAREEVGERSATEVLPERVGQVRDRALINPSSRPMLTSPGRVCH